MRKDLYHKKIGKNEFEDIAYFDFDGNTGLKSVFDYDFDVERIVDELANVVYGKKNLNIFSGGQGGAYRNVYNEF